MRPHLLYTNSHVYNRTAQKMYPTTSRVPTFVNGSVHLSISALGSDIKVCMPASWSQVQCERNHGEYCLCSVQEGYNLKVLRSRVPPGRLLEGVVHLRLVQDCLRHSDMSDA